MPLRTIDNIFKVMQFLAAQGHEKEAKADQVITAIKVCAGASDRIRNRYLQMMRELKILQVAGQGIFKLNHDRAYRYKHGLKIEG